MAGAKETPRQKMIGMMYLVLMALLAMNVSKEVLNSFIIINGAIENTNDAFSAKNASTMNEFEAQNSLNPDKVGPYLERATAIKQVADATYDSLATLKRYIIWKTEGALNEDEYVALKSEGAITSYTPEVDSLFGIKKLEKKDTYDMPTNIMIGSDPANLKEGPRTATNMKAQLQNFSESIIREVVAIVPEVKAEIEQKATMDFSDMVIDNAGKKEPWEMANFYHVPLAAVVTNLSRMQAEVRTIESDALNLLFGQISAKDFKFDKVEAKVIANSSYITLGDSFKADVIVAAYSTTDNPGLEVGTEIDTAGKGQSEWTAEDVKNPVAEERMYVKDGIAHYGFKPTSEGEVNWGGFIVLKEPGTGKEKRYPFTHTFIAAKPALVIAPTAMNVFYRGLENPVSISVSGIASSKLRPSITNGSLSKKPDGTYVVKPGNGNESVISVRAEMDNGSTKDFGKMTFRVKAIPNPEPYFAGVERSGSAPKAQLLANDVVLARLKDFVFDNVRYNVVRFEMSSTVRGNVVTQRARGNKITDNMKRIIQAQNRGGKVYIDNIIVVGPDGKERPIGSCAITVQ